MLGLRVIEPAAEAGSRLVWSVAGLVQAVADTLAARFPVCVVRGELSAFTRAASGHCYFSLKDAEGAAALLRCAMFRRAASLLDFAPADGQLVEIRGRLAVYEPRGELQFVVEGMQRAGAGALYEQFLRLKARLEAQGLFDAQRKRPIAAFPRRIGVVTSLGAAALHDVLSALARRSPQVEVVVYPSLVQGADAPAALALALATASQRAEVDTLLLCRGGGSLEDLWAFNDERVVRAVAACSMRCDRALTKGSSGGGKGSLSITTSCNASPGTSNPSQNEADATRMQPACPWLSPARNRSINRRLAPCPCTSTSSPPASPANRACSRPPTRRKALSVVVSTRVRPPSRSAASPASWASCALCPGSEGGGRFCGTYTAAWAA